jgi:DTW domain-containing protein YfiP
MCDLIPSLVTRTRLCLIVQARESRKPTNTGLLAAQCLSNSEVHVRGEEGSTLDYPAMLDPACENIFLFPGPDAEPIANLAAGPSDRPVKLFVADGNWGQAIRIHRRFQRSCPVRSVVIPPGAPTRYRIRREHGRPEGLATMEAIARAFGVLEGPHIEDALNEVFLAMVDRTLRSRGVAPSL